jgi:SNF2 family DNA or RNA helicase
MDDLPVCEPVVVFCRFRCDLEEVAAACRRLGRSHSELSGVRNSLAEWQSGETSVLAVQIQSGGVGIDLTRASYCVYYSLGFSLGDYEQSLARLHRPGQTRCVRYYHLVAKDTVDEIVYESLRKRKEIVDGVLHRLTKRGIR